MGPERDEAPKAPAIIERFLRQLVVVNKAVALYPPSSTIPRDTAEECVTILREALRERSEIRLLVGKNGLYYEDTPVFPGNQAFANFNHELYLRKLADVRFHAGSEAKDIIAFLTVLKYTPDEVTAAGGFESRLWEQGVGTITVTEASVTLVDAAVSAPRETALSASQAGAPPARDRAEIDEIIAAAFGGRSRDQVTIARIIGDPDAVRGYLEQTYQYEAEGLMAAGQRFSELAHIATEIGGEEQHELLKSLADAVWDLDPEMRRELLIEEVLPEARSSKALAAVVRQMDIDVVCKMMVDGYRAGEVTKDGLVRAIRNLALISLSDREEIVAAAGAAMLGAGIEKSDASELLQEAVPQRLTIRGSSRADRQDRPADAIFKLMELVPVPKQSEEQDPALDALQEEARRGITDGDVISALVSLVSMDTRPTQFASTMSMLEDALDLLIERGEIEVAADAATSLGEAGECPDLTPEQRLRVVKAVERFARPSDVRALARAMRLYSPGTPEHDAAERLIQTLGAQAIKPLLEYLADEPDMAARKSLVDLLSGMATNHIPELGSHVTDPRWYFVRNVVSILGSTHSSAVLMYLERTLRHPDARVRRETIRSLSGIQDRLAGGMLLAALSDEDSQNVQLSARYLGQSGMRAAIPTLESVARGEGRGNRDTGPRVEAIEALGRLGATEALPTLESLAGKRSIIGAAKARELRAASESAIAVIRSRGGAR